MPAAFVRAGASGFTRIKSNPSRLAELPACKNNSPNPSSLYPEYFYYDEVTKVLHYFLDISRKDLEKKKRKTVFFLQFLFDLSKIHFDELKRSKSENIIVLTF